MQRRFLLVAVLAAALGPVSGCGGSSSSDQTSKFKKSYVTVRRELKQTSAAIGTAITQAPSKTDAQILSAFRGLAAQWQSQLSQLETLKPPSNLATEFNTLTDSVTRIESDLNAVVAAAATHSSSAAEQAGASIVTDVNTARTADTTITTKLGISP
jgi:hypothetical protein